MLPARAHAVTVGCVCPCCDAPHRPACAQSETEYEWLGDADTMGIREEIVAAAGREGRCLILGCGTSTLTQSLAASGLTPDQVRVNLPPPSPSGQPAFKHATKAGRVWKARMRTHALAHQRLCVCESVCVRVRRVPCLAGVGGGCSRVGVLWALCCA